MIKDFKNVLSIIEECYNIKKEEKGLFFKKTVEIETLFRKIKKVYKNGKVVFEEHIWEGCGEIIRETKNYIYFPNGEYKLIIKRIDSTGNIAKTWEYLFNIQGNIINSYDSWSYRYRYDSSNRTIHKKSFCGKELMDETDWTYDNYGNCIKKHTLYYNEGSIWKDETMTYSYNINGNLIQENRTLYYKKQIGLKGVDVESVTKYKYNNYGHIIHKEYLCNGQVSNYNYELKYDSHHNCIEKRCYVTGADAIKGDWFYRYKIAYEVN